MGYFAEYIHGTRGFVMPFNALTDIDPTLEFSTNDRAKELMGERMDGRTTGVMPIDLPCELGYHCPVCKYRRQSNGAYDERLQWSQYNGFLWCAVCNRDYPSALCHPIKPSKWTAGAIDIFLNTVQAAIERDRANRGKPQEDQ